jgi:RNA binding exosome subunit
MVNSRSTPTPRRSSALKSQIQALEATCFLHATEDPAKVRRAVAELLGAESAPDEERLEGHFGNPIVRLKFHLTGTEAEGAVRRIFAALPTEQSARLSTEMGSFLDEHSALFLRFDKQMLVLGRLGLGGGDPLRVKVKPRMFQMKTDALEFYRRLLEESRAF